MCNHFPRVSDLYRISKSSKCLRLQVGAMGKDSRGNIFVGWNHMVDGSPCEINSNLSKPNVKHGEIAVLEQSDDIISLSISHSPCLSCAERILEAGVPYVEYVEDYRLPYGVDYLKRNGVTVVQLNKPESNLNPIIKHEEIS